MQQNNKVNLKKFSNSEFSKGAKPLKIALWFITNALIVRASWNPFIGIKTMLLRLFGARIGKGFVIKNNVTIKSPWNLIVGDYCWIGENVWIDNLDKVIIGNNVCISQGALLITGNHDYTKSSFPLHCAPISIENGVWIGANATVTAGVTIAENSVLTVGSVVTHDTEPNMIYKGNPAMSIRKRIIKAE